MIPNRVNIPNGMRRYLLLFSLKMSIVVTEEDVDIDFGAFVGMLEGTIQSTFFGTKVGIGLVVVVDGLFFRSSFFWNWTDEDVEKSKSERCDTCNNDSG